MTGQQAIGVLAIVIGGLAYMKQRGMCVLCGDTASLPEVNARENVAIDLYPEQPSLLGTHFDMLVADLDSLRLAGNFPGETSEPNKPDTRVSPIPNLAPGLDEYLPPNPVNPDLAAGTQDAPQLDSFNSGGSFEAVAWSIAPSTDVANESSPDDYLSVGA